MSLVIDIRCLQDKRWTGVAEYTWQYLRQFKNNNSQEVVLFANCSKSSCLPDDIGSYGQLRNLPWSSRLMNVFWKLGVGPDIAKYLRLKTGDIFWMTNPHFGKIEGRSKKIITIHDLSFLNFPDFFSLKKKLWYMPAVTRLINGLDKFDMIIAVSNHTMNDLVEFNPRLKNKIRVVYPGVDDIFFTKPSPAEIQQTNIKYTLPNKYLLTVGTLEPRKNHLLLFKAFEKLCQDSDFDYDLVVVGPIGWKYKPLTDFWQTMIFASRVHYLGYLSKFDLRSVYAGASLFLYPSFYEGFGFPALEAMAQGIPTLATSTSSLPEICGGYAMMLNPWRLDEWVQGIQISLDQMPLLFKINEAKQRAGQFTWEASVDKLLNYFKSL